MDVHAEPNQPQRVQELWFEDGNIVIQAENCQYRVFRGILAARSPVFQDMLSLPHPPETELVEGCPFVRLPDRALEVTPFLRAIFESEFFAPYPAPTDFDTIVGCLRLGHKYSVDYIFRRALIHLASDYHTTLGDSDASCEADSPIFKKTSWSPPLVAPYHYTLVIQLAREVNAPWILPMAFYDLSENVADANLDIFHGSLYKGVTVNISKEDQKSFLVGHAIQIASCLKDIPRFLIYPRVIDGCAIPNDCFAERLAKFEEFMDDMDPATSFPLDLWTEHEWESMALCHVCLAKLKKTHQAARRAFWDNLPEIYGLPPWEELEAAKVAALGTESLL
ncbi:hypothetical protein DFH06DRAFT_1155163 [Mycena polygramma]|nr:hypothetical protein DFH06DRAFT_1155163 [Mycena polygramma]